MYNHILHSFSYLCSLSTPISLTSLLFSPSFFSCPLPPFLLLPPPSPPFSAGDSCPVLQSLHVAWATGEDTFPRQHGGHYHPVFLTVDKGCRPLHGVGSVIMFNKRQILYTDFVVPKHAQNFRLVTGVGCNCT